jgi:hypothetical protein
LPLSLPLSPSNHQSSQGFHGWHQGFRASRRGIFLSRTQPRVLGETLCESHRHRPHRKKRRSIHPSIHSILCRRSVFPPSLALKFL